MMSKQPYRFMPAFVPILIILMSLPIFATETITLKQYSDLNATTPYINEFMLCYLSGNGSVSYDTYTNGTAELLFTENDTYELFCCDNCYISGSDVSIQYNSLHYLLGTLELNESRSVNYYVGDVIENLRIIPRSGTSTFSNPFSLDVSGSGIAVMIGLILIIGFSLFFFVITDSVSGLGFGAITGGIAFLIFALVSGMLPWWSLIIVAVVVIGGMSAWSRITGGR